jgi:Fe2+ transport system protein FeoA
MIFMPTLDTLKIGESATIVSIRLPAAEAQRLTEMGLTIGAQVKVQKLAPLGDPMEIIVRGYHLSLRKTEASGIEVG